MTASTGQSCGISLETTPRTYDSTDTELITESFLPSERTTNEPRYGFFSQSGLLPGEKTSGPGSCSAGWAGSDWIESFESSA